MQVRKILIPLDTSALSGQILPAVRHLFAPGETELTLLSVVPTIAPTQEGPSFDQAAWERAFKLAEGALRSEAQPLQAAEYPVTTLVRGGDPVQEIITCLEEGDYDLVAMATHGHTG